MVVRTGPSIISSCTTRRRPAAGRCDPAAPTWNRRFRRWTDRSSLTGRSSWWRRAWVWEVTRVWRMMSKWWWKGWCGICGISRQNAAAAVLVSWAATSSTTVTIPKTSTMTIAKTTMTMTIAKTMEDGTPTAPSSCSRPPPPSTPSCPSSASFPSRRRRLLPIPPRRWRRTATERWEKRRGRRNGPMRRKERRRSESCGRRAGP
mmetsp:Transcript_17661/g.50593  ORF Transcript_17661/g.50593 Transcript_17661/m.50593 type:complete len:204 (+) Transcript_17661:339-950(+)